jgi:polyisoprenoid-binding protein YceI
LREEVVENFFEKIRMKEILLAFAILLLTCPVLVRANAADWVVDSKASSVNFLVKSTLHDIHGTVGTIDGKLTLPDGGLAATGETEVSVHSLATGNRSMDRNMYAMFEAKAFPVVTLKIISIDLSGVREGADRQVVIRGLLTIHGVSREISIPAKAGRDHGRYVCEGSFSVSLKDYEMRPPRMLFLKVADQVLVHFSVIFVLP